MHDLREYGTGDTNVPCDLRKRRFTSTESFREIRIKG